MDVSCFSIEMEKKQSSREVRGKERLAPLCPWRRAQGHCLPRERAGMCPLRQSPSRGPADLSTCRDTSVFPEPGADPASAPDHLLEKMHEEYKAKQNAPTIRMHFCLCFSLPLRGAKIRAHTFLFHTLQFIDRSFPQRRDLIEWTGIFFYLKKNPLILKVLSCFCFCFLCKGKRCFLRMRTLPQNPSE